MESSHLEENTNVVVILLANLISSFLQPDRHRGVMVVNFTEGFQLVKSLLEGPAE